MSLIREVSGRDRVVTVDSPAAGVAVPLQRVGVCRLDDGVRYAVGHAAGHAVAFDSRCHDCNPENLLCTAPKECVQIKHDTYCIARNTFRAVISPAVRVEPSAAAANIAANENTLSSLSDKRSIQASVGADCRIH